MRSKKLLFIVFILAAMILAACGGGGGGDEEPVIEIDYGTQCLQELKNGIFSFIPVPEDRANLPLSCQVYYSQDDVEIAQATADAALQALNNSVEATLVTPLTPTLTLTPTPVSEG